MKKWFVILLTIMFVTSAWCGSVIFKTKGGGGAIGIRLAGPPPTWTWTERINSGSRYWWDIASDVSGRQIVATGGNGGPANAIYMSYDAGTNWTMKLTNGAISVCSSIDGKYLACGGTGGVYTSVDNGSNWSRRTTAKRDLGLRSSYSGKYLAAFASDTHAFYTSSDYGTNWTQQSITVGVSQDRNIAMSADGTTVLVTGNGPGNPEDGIYFSTDGGTNFLQGLSWQSFKSIAVSSNGLWAMSSSDANNFMYKNQSSGDFYGWAIKGPQFNYHDLAISSQGIKYLAVNSGGYLYYSGDSGETWSALTGAGSRNWIRATISGDGNRINAAISGGYIWTGVYQ